VSPGIQHQLGQPREALIGSSLAELFGEGSKALLAGEPALLQSGGRYFQAELTPSQDGEPWLVALCEVTERIYLEQQLERTNRLYNLLSQSNQAVVYSQTPEELYRRICQAAILYGRFALAWVGAPDETGWVRVLAQAGPATGYLQEIRISVDPKHPEGQGPFGRAFRSGEAVIYRTFQESPETSPWHQAAARYGLRSILVLPLKGDKGIQACFCLYAEEEDFFDPATLRIALEMREDLSFDLSSFRLRSEREEALERLKAQEESFRTIFQEYPLPMWIYDTESRRFLEVNRAAQEVYGYTREEFLALRLEDLRPPEDLPFLEEALRTPASRRSLGPLRHRLKDGYLIEVEISSAEIVFEGRTARLVVIQDVTEQLAIGRRLEYLALHDPLTGLPNRRLFLDRLDQAIRQSHRTGRPLAVAFLDLDNFKILNDSYGHEFGDQILIQVARLLERTVRAGDTVARHGGDEFLLLLVELKKREDAVRVAEKILQKMSELLEVAGREVLLKASLGVALYQEDLDPGELISQADLAMYRPRLRGIPISSSNPR